jgi:hypothetical protein
MLGHSASAAAVRCALAFFRLLPKGSVARSRHRPRLGLTPLDAELANLVRSCRGLRVQGDSTPVTRLQESRIRHCPGLGGRVSNENLPSSLTTPEKLIAFREKRCVPVGSCCLTDGLVAS